MVLSFDDAKPKAASTRIELSGNITQWIWPGIRQNWDAGFEKLLAFPG